MLAKKISLGYFLCTLLSFSANVHSFDDHLNWKQRSDKNGAFHMNIPHDDGGSAAWSAAPDTPLHVNGIFPSLAVRLEFNYFGYIYI